MSWDIELRDDRGHEEGWWNYTYNVSPMLNAAAEAAGVDCGDESAMRHLDGMSGVDGAAYLLVLMRELQANPPKYIAMNPPNGWGSYGGVLGLLGEMIRVVPAWPCVWTVH